MSYMKNRNQLLSHGNIKLREYALDIMVSRGIATMQVVPYESLGDCSSSPSFSFGTYHILDPVRYI